MGRIGFGVVLLIAAKFWISGGLRYSIAFWSAYIPIVVAMAAQWNVVAAVDEGPIVLVACIVAVTLCFVSVALLSRFYHAPAEHEAARPFDRIP